MTTAIPRRGTVVGGKVLLDDGDAPPDGTKVDVVVPVPDTQTPDDGGPTLGFLQRFIGCAPDLPADFAEQHDHYIHGTPKR